jgi:glycosyltransferase involved in cell wall biosynthesis
MKCAVVVSRTRALQEIVEDGVTGRTFTPDDPRNLAAVCAELIARPDERSRLAAAGRAWVAAERSWASRGQRYSRALRAAQRDPRGALMGGVPIATGRTQPPQASTLQ